MGRGCEDSGKILECDAQPAGCLEIDDSHA